MQLKGVRKRVRNSPNFQGVQHATKECTKHPRRSARNCGDQQTLKEVRTRLRNSPNIQGGQLPTKECTKHPRMSTCDKGRYQTFKEDHKQ
jgi:hypothetical protein